MEFQFSIKTKKKLPFANKQFLITHFIFSPPLILFYFYNLSFFIYFLNIIFLYFYLDFISSTCLSPLSLISFQISKSMSYLLTFGRKGNQAAHLLAKHAQSVEQYVAWIEENPCFLEHALSTDVLVSSRELLEFQFSIQKKKKLPYANKQFLITHFIFSPPFILFYFYNLSFFIFLILSFFIVSPPHVYLHLVLSHFKFQKASLISLPLVSHHVGTQSKTL